MPGGKWRDPVVSADWTDTGCAIAPACLACPLPACVLDISDRADHALIAMRDAVIRRLYDQGTPAKRLAEDFGIHRRSVYRVLGGVRRRRAA